MNFISVTTSEQSHPATLPPSAVLFIHQRPLILRRVLDIGCVWAGSPWLIPAAASGRHNKCTVTGIRLSHSPDSVAATVGQTSEEVGGSNAHTLRWQQCSNFESKCCKRGVAFAKLPSLSLQRTSHHTYGIHECKASSECTHLAQIDWWETLNPKHQKVSQAASDTPDLSRSVALQSLHLRTDYFDKISDANNQECHLTGHDR